jgi:hypothetical protein
VGCLIKILLEINLLTEDISQNNSDQRGPFRRFLVLQKQRWTFPSTWLPSKGALRWTLKASVTADSVAKAEISLLITLVASKQQKLHFKCVGLHA